MNVGTIALAVVSILAKAPQLIDDAENIYREIAGGLTPDQTQTVDEAFAAARAGDVAATAAAHEKLQNAAKA